MKKRLVFYSRSDNTRAPAWIKRLTRHITENYPTIEIGGKKPHFVVVLGGDGTICEAARVFRKDSPIIVGLNLGHVGFLASARHPNEFVKTIDALCRGHFTISERMTVHARLFRHNKPIYETNSLNEVVMQGLSGAIKLSVAIDGHPLQYVHGNGVMIATPTGSTAYNLSAHGPIVTPDIKCFIVTELLDHNIPTPSLIIKRTKTIQVTITEVRAKGLLTVARTGEPVDAALTSDDMEIFPLHEGDRIEICQAKRLTKFAEFTTEYFYKSLQEKFAFE